MEIAIISAIISAMAVIITVIFNSISHIQYINSLDPLLSFCLFEYDGILYLSVTNTGKSAAKEVRVQIKGLFNNGDNDELHLDALFQDTFELYPNETVQGMVGIYGENVCTHVFPFLKADVNYNKGQNEQNYECHRSIIFSPGCDKRVLPDTGVDTGKISDSLVSLSRSNIRIANYLDGHQLAHFDEINLLPGSSLKKDMCDVFGKDKAADIEDRAHTIANSTKRKNT